MRFVTRARPKKYKVVCALIALFGAALGWFAGPAWALDPDKDLRQSHVTAFALDGTENFYNPGVHKAAKLVASIDPKILFILQPNYLDLKKGVIEQCVGYQNACSKILKDVRVLPQVHKFMKIR